MRFMVLVTVLLFDLNFFMHIISETAVKLTFELRVSQFRRATRVKVGKPLLIFSENREKCYEFRKKTLIVSIFGLNFPFEM